MVGLATEMFTVTMVVVVVVVIVEGGVSSGARIPAAALPGVNAVAAGKSHATAHAVVGATGTGPAGCLGTRALAVDVLVSGQQLTGGRGGVGSRETCIQYKQQTRLVSTACLSAGERSIDPIRRSERLHFCRRFLRSLALAMLVAFTPNSYLAMKVTTCCTILLSVVFGGNLGRWVQRTGHNTQAAHR
jgi:hypothetical protein